MGSNETTGEHFRVTWQNRSIMSLSLSVGSSVEQGIAAIVVVVMLS